MISVIIPVYNKEMAVARSIRSVLNQNYTDYEIIVVNDGSTDNSVQVVRSFDDSCIQLIEQENMGPSKARNVGVQCAKGDWIIFLDADDELLPDALSTFWSLHLKQEDADIIDCGSQIRNRDSIETHTHQRCGYMRNNFRTWFGGELMPGTGHSMFRATLIRNNPYNEQIRRYEDAELLFRVLENARVYRSNEIAFVVNTQFSSASTPRQDITQDFIGHLDFSCRSFWRMMCMYRFFIEERENYPEACRELYPALYYRYDLLFILKCFPFFRSLLS